MATFHVAMHGMLTAKTHHPNDVVKYAQEVADGAHGECPDPWKAPGA